MKKITLFILLSLMFSINLYPQETKNSFTAEEEPTFVYTFLYNNIANNNYIPLIGVVNLSGNSTSASIGVVNVSDEVFASVGVLNISFKKVTLALCVVNINKESIFQIGVVNISEKSVFGGIGLLNLGADIGNYHALLHIFNNLDWLL